MSAAPPDQCFCGKLDRVGGKWSCTVDDISWTWSPRWVTEACTQTVGDRHSFSMTWITPLPRIRRHKRNFTTSIALLQLWSMGTIVVYWVLQYAAVSPRHWTFVLRPFNTSCPLWVRLKEMPHALKKCHVIRIAGPKTSSHANDRTLFSFFSCDILF